VYLREETTEKDTKTRGFTSDYWNPIRKGTFERTTNDQVTKPKDYRTDSGVV